MGFLSEGTAGALARLAALDAFDAGEADGAGVADGSAVPVGTDAPASPLGRLRAIRDLAVALEADSATLAAVREAVASGTTWDEVADAAGLSPSAAKYRWAGDDDAIEARQEASRKRKRDRPSSVPTDLPGESVSEAAKRLGVTPQAIYQRVTRGLLESRTVELPDGRTYKRVFVPDTSREPPPAGS